jgi:tRNA nucleotidyltransferase (CCA-adding enzyme)
VAQHGIMANAHICRLVNDAFKNYKEIIWFKTALINDETWTQDRSVGMRMREWQFTGGKENGNWRIQALFALLVEVMNRHESHEIVEAAVIAEWQRFIDKLEELDVMDAPSTRPLVDGDFMKSQLGVEKGGPWMAEAMNICMAYQLQHPSVTDPQEIFTSLKDEILEVFQKQMQAAMAANVARIRAEKKIEGEETP